MMLHNCLDRARRERLIVRNPTEDCIVPKVEKKEMKILRQEDIRAAEAALERMGISHLSDRMVSTLSGGQRQKAYIAMALTQDTPVMLLDEPNTFLDIAHQLQLMSQARALAEEGKTVVLVLHDLALALEWADSVAVLSEGKLLFQGRAEETFSSGCLDIAFGVKMYRILTPEGWKYCYGAACS